MSKKWQTILLHIFGCLAFLSLPVLFSPDFSKGELIRIRPFQVDFLTYLVMIGFFYLNFYLLIPRLYFKKKHFVFALVILACFAVTFFLPPALAIDHGPQAHHPPGMMPGETEMHMPRPRPSGMLFDLRQRFLQFLFPLTLSMLLRIGGRLRETESAKQKAELSYLKAQINPHFLFNILNSIYSLSIDKSEHTSEAIVKLSGMMRYMLEESDKKLVPLDHEIEYITNYIDLQKLRFGNSVKTELSVSGNMQGFLIAPLMLIPFVENAFKHGVNAEENSEIKISVAIGKNMLQLSVWNSKVFIKNSNDRRQGLGIKNTRNRLNMVYPGKHELLVDDNAAYYSVKLSINLA